MSLQDGEELAELHHLIDVKEALLEGAGDRRLEGP